MLVFMTWGGGDILSQTKYVGISGLISTGVTFLFCLLWVWIYIPVCAALVLGYALCIAGVQKVEPKYLFISKIILALTIPVSAFIAILLLFLVAAFFGGYFITFFIFFVGIAYTCFAVLMIHRAHVSLTTSNQATAYPPPPPQPMPTEFGVNPSNGHY